MCVRSGDGLFFFFLHKANRCCPDARYDNKDKRFPRFWVSRLNRRTCACACPPLITPTRPCSTRGAPPSLPFLMRRLILCTSIWLCRCPACLAALLLPVAPHCSRDCAAGGLLGRAGAIPSGGWDAEGAHGPLADPLHHQGMDLICTSSPTISRVLIDRG